MKINEFETRLTVDGCVYVRETANIYIVDGRKCYNNTEALSEFFGDVVGIRDCAEEHVYVACMDIKNHIIGCFEASHGSVNVSMFPIREILQKSLMIGAVNIAIAHNHPSGDCMPSKDDILATNKLKEACSVVGIGFVDHVIVSQFGYWSMVAGNNIS